MKNSVEEAFAFFTARGFTLERDYSKGTDSTCTQICRLRRDGANWLELRVLSARERCVVVCVQGEKRFPSPEKTYAARLRRRKFKAFFTGEKEDDWQRFAFLCRMEYERTGSLFGLPVGE